MDFCLSVIWSTQMSDWSLNVNFFAYYTEKVETMIADFKKVKITNKTVISFLEKIFIKLQLKLVKNLTFYNLCSF